MNKVIFMQRGRAVVARLPHKQQVEGSNPSPAKDTIQLASTWRILGNANN